MARKQPGARKGSKQGLLKAIQSGDLEGVREQLATGMDVNFSVPISGSPLMLAAEEENLEIVRALITAGADVNLQKNFCNPLYCAFSRARFENALALLEAGADPNSRMLLGNAPLLEAVGHGQGNLVPLQSCAIREGDSGGNKRQPRRQTYLDVACGAAEPHDADVDAAVYSADQWILKED